MSAVPELKQKKIARDAELSKAAAAAAAKAATDAAEAVKSNFAKAKAYEEEYEAVSSSLVPQITPFKVSDVIGLTYTLG
jgi:hypothetical protein